MILVFLESEDVSIAPNFWKTLSQLQKECIYKSIVFPHEANKKVIWEKFPTFIPINITAEETCL